MSVLKDLRDKYHDRIAGDLLGCRMKDGKRGPNTIADVGSKTSVAIAAGIVKALNRTCADVPDAGQTLGLKFAEYTREFLDAAFARLRHIRPGDWLFSSSQADAGIAAYEQYEHLIQLQRILAAHPDLRAALGGDYIITPDIVVARRPVDDRALNHAEPFVDKSEAALARQTPLRAGNLSGSLSILHASISCKWTIRSDRGQNTRTEALNLIRNRKGRTPHIMVVTAEPLPMRIASIAQGTGDVDCTYHAFLPELVQATPQANFPDQHEVLTLLISGRRLRDISDLPLDLAT